jgi:hypothetical protein
MRTRGEMSEPIAAALGEAPDRKFHLFPISTRDRVTAILYADPGQGPIQPDALELLASAAGAVLEGRAPAPGAGLVNIAENGRAKPDPMHAQAQRFARLQVAEMRLYKSDVVKSARESADLYISLKAEIDSARETFRRDFIANSSGMVDYLHLELVHRLANDEVKLLGPDYPGPMV